MIGEKEVMKGEKVTTRIFTSENGQEVRIHRNRSGYSALIIGDEAAMYNPQGELICGVADECTAVWLLGEGMLYDSSPR